MGNHMLQVAHKAIGELLQRGFTVIDDDDQADEFEDIIAAMASYDRSSGGHRFTLADREWNELQRSRRSP